MDLDYQSCRLEGLQKKKKIGGGGGKRVAADEKEGSVRQGPSISGSPELTERVAPRWYLYQLFHLTDA